MGDWHRGSCAEVTRLAASTLQVFKNVSEASSTASSVRPHRRRSRPGGPCRERPPALQRPPLRGNLFALLLWAPLLSGGVGNGTGGVTGSAAFVCGGTLAGGSWRGRRGSAGCRLGFAAARINREPSKGGSLEVGLWRRGPTARRYPGLCRRGEAAIGPAPETSNPSDCLKLPSVPSARLVGVPRLERQRSRHGHCF